VALETAEGDHDVLAKGFPAEPLRLTFRGRRELPVNVENIAAACAAGAAVRGGWLGFGDICTGGDDGKGGRHFWSWDDDKIR
jgi:hypothetical protein